MDIQEFITKFSEVVDIDDTSALNGSTKFRDLDEWNSLAALSVISMFEDELGKQLPLADFRNAVTIKDLYSLGFYHNV